MIRSIINKSILLICIIFLYISSNCFAEKTYVGTAVPLVTEDIYSGSDASYYGTVKYIAEKGELIEPKITDLKGNVINPGTIVMQQGTKYWQAIVEASKADILTGVQDIVTATANLKRYAELTPIGAESVENYQIYKNNYYKYLGAYLSDKGALQLAEVVLKSRTFYAPFEGYVSKVMYTLGHASDNPETVIVTMLNPIGIRIKMPRETANKITPETPVTVYIPGTDIKQGVLNGFSMLISDGILFMTDNSPKRLPPELCKNVKFYIKDCYPVEYLYTDTETNNTLCLPKSSIMKDDKGYYIWKAENRKFLVAGKAFNPVFQVKKIYIEPANLERLFAGRIYYRAIVSNKNIEFGDVIIYNPPKNLISGDTVAIPPKKYMIMPGDAVKIIIGE